MSHRRPRQEKGAQCRGRHASLRHGVRALEAKPPSTPAERSLRPPYLRLCRAPPAPLPRGRALPCRLGAVAGPSGYWSSVLFFRSDRLHRGPSARDGEMMPMPSLLISQVALPRLASGHHVAEHSCPPAEGRIAGRATALGGRPVRRRLPRQAGHRGCWWRSCGPSPAAPLPR